MSKRIVAESLREYFGGDKLNEDLVDSLKNLVTKVGDFLAFKSDTEKGYVKAMSPTNIGLLKASGRLKTYVYYAPSQADIELEAELSNIDRSKFMLADKVKTWIKWIKDKLNLSESLNEDGETGSYKEGEIKQEMPKSHPSYHEVGDIYKEDFIWHLQDALDRPQEKKLLIWGAPGIGKTAIAKQVVEKYNGRIIGVQLSSMIPDDWNLPALEKDEKGKLTAIDLPKTWLPVYQETGDPEVDKERDMIANGGYKEKNGTKVEGRGGILFLDELTRAKPGVLTTCLTLINEGEIAGYRLGSKWAVVSAANRAEDEPNLDDIAELGTAMGGRLAQANYILRFKDWKEYAISKGIRQEILDFIEMNQDFFYKWRRGSTLGANPRSWEKASQTLDKYYKWAEENDKKVDKKGIINVLKLDIGMPIASEVANFMSLLEKYSKEDLRKPFTAPKQAPLPPKKGSGYDLSEAHGLILAMLRTTAERVITPKEFENFMKYLVRLDNQSLASTAFKLTFRFHDYLNDELGEYQDEEGNVHNKYIDGFNVYTAKYKIEEEEKDED